MGGTIFVSYRRGADSGFAGRLYDRLEYSFGHQRVFMDVDSIAPGEDFVAALQAWVAQCDVLLALIGRGWLNVTDEAGQRRLDNPEDFVRIEIAAALAQGKRVIPVLTDDAAMPRREDLPEEIKPLARRNATRLTHDRFKDDAERLVRALEKALADAEAARQAEDAKRQQSERERQRAEEEARQHAEAEAARKAEEERQRAASEAKRQAQDQERQRTEEEAKRQRDERERQRAEEEARQHAEAEAARNAEEERQRAASEAKRQAEDRERRRAEEKAEDRERRRAEEKARLKVAEASGRAEFVVFSDIRASWCPEMVPLPTGKFLMGSPEGEGGRFANEGPQHQVTIGTRFAIGRFPVTFEEFDYFCDATKREKPKDQGWGRGRRPAINLSWRDAQAYVEWLARETRKPYRLPSEAEWEYACRAGTTTPFSFGETITEKDANFGGHVGTTTEVGAYSANAWGLHDMHGNVWEWVEDVWHDSYQAAPTDGSAWTDGEGKNSSRIRVFRGGSWGNGSWYLRSALRVRVGPGNEGSVLGFRIARTLR